MHVYVCMSIFEPTHRGIKFPGLRSIPSPFFGNLYNTLVNVPCVADDQQNTCDVDYPFLDRWVKREQSEKQAPICTTGHQNIVSSRD